MDKGTPQSDEYVRDKRQRDQLDIIRRTAERGLSTAQYEMSARYCDLFQHILDELERI